MNPCWSECIFQKCKPQFELMLNSRLIKGLVNGELSDSSFKHFLEQDTIYLHAYANNLLHIAKMIPTKEHKEMFLQLSREGILAEKEIEEKYAKRIGGLSPYIIPSKTTIEYIELETNIIQQNNAATSLAVILPCFKYYNDLGKYMIKNASHPNKYEEWITTYTSSTMDRVVESIIQLANHVAEESSSETREEMDVCFYHAAIGETKFINQIR